MSLTDRFVDYLTEPSRWPALAASLASSPFQVEAALLRGYGERGPHVASLGDESGRWAGRRVHVGADLPRPSVGELWFDPCECVTMLVVPNVPEEETRTWAPSARARYRPEHGWISLRPVTKWQFGAFLRVATMRPRATREVPSVVPLDGERLVAGDETEFVVHATVAEAALYWVYFGGKAGSDQDDWQALRRLFGDEGIEAVWGHRGREWAGGIGELDAFVALGRDAIDIDYRDECDREEEEPPPADERRFFGPWEAPGDVAFRTAVAARDGLRTAPASKGAIELLDILHRERWPR